jgi:hypothetical protein
LTNSSTIRPIGEGDSPKDMKIKWKKKKKKK